jgi:hypothetical protein
VRLLIPSFLQIALAAGSLRMRRVAIDSGACAQLLALFGRGILGEHTLYDGAERRGNVERDEESNGAGNGAAREKSKEQSERIN